MTMSIRESINLAPAEPHLSGAGLYPTTARATHTQKAVQSRSCSAALLRCPTASDLLTYSPCSEWTASSKTTIQLCSAYSLHKFGPEVFCKTQRGITQFGVCKWCFGKPLADYFIHRGTLTQYAEEVAAAQHWSSDSW